RGAAAGGVECLSPAERANCGPARVFLGGPARLRSAAVLFGPAEADLPGSELCARDYSCAGRVRGPRSSRGTALGEAQSEGRDPYAAARAEEGHAGPRSDEFEAQLRCAVPGPETLVAGHSGGRA